MGTKQPDQSCPDSDADVCHCCHLLILFIQDGTFSCEKKACPAVTCLNPAAGECCPECNNCQLDGRLYQNGQRFPDPTDLCQQCACEVSVAVSCSRQIFSFSYSAQFSPVWYVCTQEGPYVLYPISQRFPQRWPFHVLSRKIVKHFVFLCLSPPGIVGFFETQLTM